MDPHRLNFEPAATLSIPAGTRAPVKVALIPDGQPSLATGSNAYGRWLRMDFDLADGAFAGRRAAMMLTLDPNNSESGPPSRRSPASSYARVSPSR